MTQNIKDTTKSSSQREVYSNSTSAHETRKTSNKQANLTPKATKKNNNNKVRRKEIIKIRAEINETEMKKNNKKDQ